MRPVHAHAAEGSPPVNARRLKPVVQRTQTDNPVRVSLSADEFWRLADWARSPENLAYHVETLVSWAPVELLEKPSAVTDEAGHLWYLCKFRYFGPVRERETLILSVRSALDNLTSWRDVEEHR